MKLIFPPRLHGKFVSRNLGVHAALRSYYELQFSLTGIYSWKRVGLYDTQTNPKDGLYIGPSYVDYYLPLVLVLK